MLSFPLGARRPTDLGAHHPGATLPPVTDRHARFRRADADRRRRPVDGSRASSGRRFARLVDDALASLPPGLLAYLGQVQLHVEDVPPVDEADEVVLVSYTRAGAPQVGALDAIDQLTIYRRPLEARARDRLELLELLREVIVHEVADRHGLDDDQLDELGWG
jgi:predicted Zn-dependent protease with MMP-like domain